MAPLTGAAEAAVQGFFRGRRGTRVLRPAHGSFERRTASLDCVPRYPHECCRAYFACVLSVACCMRAGVYGAAVCVYCPAAFRVWRVRAAGGVCCLPPCAPFLWGVAAHHDGFGEVTGVRARVSPGAARSTPMLLNILGA